jgi:hypothetical protein
MNFRVPENVGIFLSSCTTGAVSRRAQLHEVSMVHIINQLVVSCNEIEQINLECNVLPIFELKENMFIDVRV